MRSADLELDADGPGSSAEGATRLAVGFELDPSQLAVLELPADACALVTGAPGSGKTSTAIELIAHRVEQHGLSPDEVLLLAPSRHAATRLRGELARRLDRATNGPLARTLTSIAFEIVRHAAALTGSAAPVLLTGAEQDQVMRELLEGHIRDAAGPVWPEPLIDAVRSLRGFRTELRDLLMRATEHGISPERMRRLGVEQGRPEWVAAAEFATEYYDVIAAANPDAIDSAELVSYAVAAVERGELPARIAGIRLLVVDDLQELTESGLRLVTALQRAGCAVVAFGDPDTASGAFRGAAGGAVGMLPQRIQLTELVLGIAHRHGPALRDLVSRVTARIGTASVSPARRRAPHGRDPDSEEPIVIVREPSSARELAAIARILREHHLLREVPLHRMAVVLRSGAQVPAYARGLALAEVPTRTSAAAQALREAPAALALLTLIDTAIDRSPLTADSASALLLGPFGGFDRLGLRRLRLALRAEELAGGGNRQADELLVEALSAAGHLATIDDRVGRAATRLATVMAELRQRHGAGATVEELLWLAWERSGLAEQWRAEALGSGPIAAEAGRRLDAVLAVFTAARRFVERRPGHAAEEFLASVLDAEVPEDTLAPQQLVDTVLVTTPAGVVGAEFDVVVIAGLQEGVWPNPKVRGTLLHPDALVAGGEDQPSAVEDARRQVVHDELRLFALAASRARSHVVLAAVVNDDSAESVVLSLVPAPAFPSASVSPRSSSSGRASSPPLSLRGMTGALRRALTSPRGSEREQMQAAAALARLAAEQLPGAAPREWHGLLPVSTEAALYEGQEHVPISPSRIDDLLRSPLDWFVDTVAGSEPGLPMAIGTVVHWALEHAGDARDVDSLWVLVEQRIGELVFEAPWVAETEQRRMRRMLTGVAEYLVDADRDGVVVVANESEFRLELGRARLRGTVDRIELHTDGRVEIVDLKTGRSVPSQAKIDEHPQLKAYQFAYRSGQFDHLFAAVEHRAGGAKLVYVQKELKGKHYKAAPQPILDDEGAEAFRELVVKALTAITAARFEGPLEPERQGRSVPFRLELHRVPEVTNGDEQGNA